jgi:hypothetical protein
MMVVGDPKKPARPYWFFVDREMPAVAIKSAEQEVVAAQAALGIVCERRRGFA